MSLPLIIRKPIVVLYVSGHGFGHASRSREVAAMLAGRLPGLDLHVRTMAPAFLFRGMDPPPARLTLTPVAVDVGLVQRDGLSFDLRKTRHALDAFARGLPALERQELRFLRALRPSVILSDIAPLPLAWASRLGIPGVALGNFGWDGIYRAFARRDPAFLAHAERAAEAYGTATLLLRLPFALPMPSFPRVLPIPLVVRRLRADPEALRAKLRPRGRRIVFASFGGFGVRELPLPRLADSGRYLLVLSGKAGDGFDSGRNVRTFAPDRLDHVGMVAAADVVLGKPGYGLVSEMVAYGRRMVYTSRGRFPEYRVLAAALRRTGRALYCPRPALTSGAIGPYLERALALPEREHRPRRTDGASVAAETLASLIEGSPATLVS